MRVALRHERRFFDELIKLQTVKENASPQARRCNQPAYGPCPDGSVRDTQISTSLFCGQQTFLHVRHLFRANWFY